LFLGFSLSEVKEQNYKKNDDSAGYKIPGCPLNLTKNTFNTGVRHWTHESLCCSRVECFRMKFFGTLVQKKSPRNLLGGVGGAPSS